MQLNDKVQHVYLVGAKSLGAYGGYETFVYKLTEYHQNKENIKYHVACKANGDGCMDESKFEGVTKINDHEFELHNAHCFKIDVPQIGPAQAIYYDVAALKTCCEHIKKNHIPHPIVYIMACRIGPFAAHFYKEIPPVGTKLYTAPPKRQPLTDAGINEIADSMPGGLAGFMKGWGWQQFARAIEAAHGIGAEHDAR